MSLYLYEIFETAADQLSFVKAAEMFNLTPSAISHSIAKLEQQVGFKLFIRSRKGVRLTGEGELLLPQIKRLREEDENLTQLISQINKTESGIIRFGTFSSVTVLWLSEVLHSFRIGHPGIEIRVMQGSYKQINHWIENKLVDITFASASALPPDSNAIPLYNDSIMVAVSKGVKPLNHTYFTSEDLKYMTFILPNAENDVDCVKIIEDYRLPVASRFRLDTDEAMLSMVKAGFGACIVPKLVYDYCHIDVDLYPFVPAYYRTISLVCPSSSPATLMLRDEIINYVHKLQ